MLLLASIRDALLALEEGQGETFKQLQAVLFHQGQEVGLLELKAGVSIIFKIRVFYKAWFEGFEFFYKVALCSFL